MANLIVRTLTNLVRPKTKGEMDAYFGPGVEIPPIAPKGEDPRGWQYWPFQNQNFIPRPDAEYNAQSLRNLSRYIVARICIENCKDVITNKPRQIRAKKKPGETNKDVDKRSKGDATLKMLNDFFDCPDGVHDWARWAREWLEGVYVGDWASISVTRKRNGGVYSLDVIDGAFINRQIDERGFTPKPPLVAYQQLWSGTPSTVGGIPYVDLTMDQLVYWPRNIVPGNTVSSYLYGMSPTEQLAPELVPGIERLKWWTLMFTSGTIPDMIHVVPPSISPDQLAKTQKAINAEMSGQTWKRAGAIKLLQGFVERDQQGGASGDQFVQPKEKLMLEPWDDAHLKKVAFGYGSSVQRLQKQLNRASAQAGQEASEEEGTQPVANSLRDCMNWILSRIFKLGDAYEMTYDQPLELDAVKLATADKSDVDSGIVTRDEARQRRGLDPVGGDADMLMITTTTGTVPVEMDDQLAFAQKKQDMATEAAQATQDDAEPGGGKGGKVRKKKAPRLDPGRDTPATRQARAGLEHALKGIFGRQKEKAKAAAERVLKMRKADDSEKKADEIFDAIKGEFASLPAQARGALEQAALAGITDGILQMEISDGKFISSVNTIASEYAAKRAAEMVGMKYNTLGELVTNPNPKWAISETTRDRLREIVKIAFEEKTSATQVVDRIMNADIFSDARAEMIARTEVATAQVQSNFKVWKDAGVKEVKWLALGPDPCPVCLDNDGEVRKIGEAFPSGDKLPLAHPHCYCILTAVGFK